MNTFAALAFSALLIFSNSGLAKKRKSESINRISGQVEQCHDGDTCRVLHGKKSLKIRFAGIDCPEISQKFGKDAKRFTESLVKGQIVDLECNGKSFDRLTCTMFLKGRNINQEIVQNGWAYDSTKYSKGRYLASVSGAKAKGLGIWREKDLLSPYCYRHKANQKCKHDPGFMP